jgi:beta-lysine 5,6-aminomutase beta subunit
VRAGLGLPGLRGGALGGGPRITNKLAVEIGYDVGFGRGAYANDVATFIVRRMVERARSA